LPSPPDDPVARDPVARDPVVSRFGVADGLPAGWIDALTVAGRVRFLPAGRTVLFRMDSQSGSAGFVPDTTFDALLPQGTDNIRLAEDERGRVWIAAAEASGVAHPSPAGGYTFAPTALRRVPNLTAYGMFAEAGGPVWVGGPDGLVRLDTEGHPGGGQTERTFDSSTDYPVWIRRITASADSLHYDGQRTRPDEAPAWSYQNNALRFAFAAPRYDAPERTHYRTRLDGLVDDWSKWTRETDKDYTNLWEGRYVFRVQARDVYGFLSREDAFGFRILPPWYRAWWAYTLYSLAFAAVIFRWVRSHRQALERERAVSARLREVDRLKDEFLANTSHELRTPLNGITGLAESLIDGVAGEVPAAVKSNLSMIVQSGRRLGHLVGDILDFSRLRHKSLELDPRPLDLHSLV
ncbi:MAG: hypothetical protein GY929_20200, partial [Actinomycetia bacterium]|nr:hypothetical protein [Actinomycetes bacterium]